MDNLDINSNPLQDPPKSGMGQVIRKPWFILLLSAVVFCVVAALSINKIMTSLLHSRAEVIVPDLEGKSLMESLRITSEMDLALREDGTEFDEGLPAGTVLRQHPPAGMQVRAGRSIRVVVSKGGQAVFVPGIVSKPLAEAQSLIQAERLQLGAVSSVYSVEAGEGIVVSQNPSSGTVVTRGALIDIEVSKGLPPAGAPLVPDFKGQPSETAKDWAEGVGAAVKISEDSRSVGVAGTVIKQSPSAGQPLMEGDTIRLTVVPLAAQSGERFRFQVPSDKGSVAVRVMARDSRGESQIYKGTHKGGDTIELPISVTSTTRVRVYVDEILAEERVLEP